MATFSRLRGTVAVLAALSPLTAFPGTPLTPPRGTRPAAAPAAGLLPGSGSKEPIVVTSDDLDYLKGEDKLVYTGHVAAAQGEATLKATRLTIDLQKDAAAEVPPAAGKSSVRHMEADGPVTLTDKDQIGTGDHGSYDRDQNRMELVGHVTLSQGPDVTQGDRLIYDMASGRAKVVGNVTSLFAPGDAPHGGTRAAPKP